MVVGTTAVTGKQVVFDNLGLVVVDEEQRLGVGQKEKLKVRCLFCPLVPFDPSWPVCERRFARTPTLAFNPPPIP